MEAVVQNSSSLYSAYISTVDHLPCDIVRSLWLVQTCNLALDKQKQDLHHLLQKHNANLLDGQGAGDNNVAHEYYKKQTRILYLHDEAVAELDSLCNQLAAHEKMVKDQIAQLQAVAEAPLAKETETLELLRQQLRDHYRENPLSSQVEALTGHERILHDLGRVVIKKAPRNGEGIKIIFKLSPKLSAGPDGSKKLRRSKGSVPKANAEDVPLIRKIPKSRGLKVLVELAPTLKASVADSESSSAQLKKRRASRLPLRPGRPPLRDVAPKRSKRFVPRASRKLISPGKIVKPKAPQTVVVEPQKKKESQNIPANLPELVFLTAPLQEEDKELYCFCRQGSFGDMIACDNEKCPKGEWFHYKCVGLLNRVEALKYTTQKWYCSDECRAAGSAKPQRKRRRRKKIFGRC